MDQKEQISLLERISRILFWSFILSYGILIIWFLVYEILGIQVYFIHSRLYPMSLHEFDLIMYFWMGFFKILIMVFFLVPWFAIKIVLRKK